jgi:hypothetical protein
VDVALVVEEGAARRELGRGGKAAYEESDDDKAATILGRPPVPLPMRLPSPVLCTREYTRRGCRLVGRLH